MKDMYRSSKDRTLFHLAFWILFFITSLYRFEIDLKSIFEGRVLLLAGHKLLFSLAFFYLYDARFSKSAEINFLIMTIIFSLLTLIYIYTNYEIYGWVVNHLELPAYIKPTYEGNWNRMSLEGPWTMLKDPTFLFVKVFAILFFPFILRVIKRAYLASLNNVKMEQEKIELEIDFYKSRVNPVFLLNTLRSIRQFSDKEDERAPEMILQLSNLMRHSLYETDAEQIGLQKEIDFIEEYITLQETRLKDLVNISFFLRAKNIIQVTISPMLLFPFFEYAFQNAGAFVEAEISVEGKELALKLKSDKQSQSGSTVVEIQNARMRIQREYEKRYTIKLSDTDAGFEVELYLELTKLK